MNCLYTIPLCNFGFAIRHPTCVIVKDFGKALLKTKSSPIFFSYKLSERKPLFEIAQCTGRDVFFRSPFWTFYLLLLLLLLLVFFFFFFFFLFKFENLSKFINFSNEVGRGIEPQTNYYKPNHTTIVQTHINPSDFYRQVKRDSRKTIGFNNSFTLIENKFRFLR